MRRIIFEMLDDDWKDYNLLEIDREEVIYRFSPEQFKIKLFELPYHDDIDIYLEDMLEYLIDEEFYEYCRSVQNQIDLRILRKHLERIK